MDEDIIYDIRDSVATITINRPDSYNSLPPYIYVEMQNAFKHVDADSSVRCIVLTGKGKAFSSGGYLSQKELETTFSPETLRRTILEKLNPLIRTIQTTQHPVVAAINGPCVGAGAGIALSCDLSLASDSAYFLFPFVNIGLATDGGVAYFLTRLLGPKKAMEVSLFGEKISAKNAFESGMINQVVPADAFEKELKALTERVARGPYSQNLIKRLVNRALQVPLDAYLDEEAEFQSIAAKSMDAREGIASFMRRATPRFKGI